MPLRPHSFRGAPILLAIFQLLFKPHSLVVVKNISMLAAILPILVQSNSLILLPTVLSTDVLSKLWAPILSNKWHLLHPLIFSLILLMTMTPMLTYPLLHHLYYLVIPLLLPLRLKLILTFFTTGHSINLMFMYLNADILIILVAHLLNLRMTVAQLLNGLFTVWFVTPKIVKHYTINTMMLFFLDLLSMLMTMNTLCVLLLIARHGLALMSVNLMLALLN